MAVADGEIFVDLAGARGAKQGDVVELWRPVELRHPVTRQRIRDRFPIGTITLSHVGESLARATDVSGLDREPQRGDIVILRRAVSAARPAPPPAPPPTIPPWPTDTAHAPDQAEPTAPGGAAAAPGKNATPVKPAAEPTKPASPAERDAQAVTELFDSLRGSTVVKRVNAYEAWVAKHPESPYSTFLFEEAALLRRAVGVYQELQQSRARKLDVTIEQFAPPEEALPDQPLTMALRLRGKPTAVIIHLRTTGQPSFETMTLRRTGRDYYSVTIPAKRMEEPGLEYFFEATSPDGKSHPLLGGVGAPLRVEVRSIPEPTRFRPPRATVALWTDYADYNRFRGNDVAWQTEGYFGMRFGDIGVRALRSGFGVYRGVGGSLEDLDELDKSPRKIGLTYGYLEGEFGIHELFSVLARPVVGLGDDGITGGAQTLVRIGNDLGTNLQLGGEILGTVGLRGIAQFELKVFEDWPMMLRSEVTNQPAGSASSLGEVRPDVDDALPEDTSLDANDIGVRGIAQVGYRIVDSLIVSVRGSYQGRTINHSGPGFGGAISYSW